MFSKIILFGLEQKKKKESKKEDSRCLINFLEKVYSYHTVPCEVWFVLFTYLSLIDLYVLQFTCKKFCLLFNQEKRFKKYSKMTKQIIDQKAWSCILQNNLKIF